MALEIVDKCEHCESEDIDITECELCGFVLRVKCMTCGSEDESFHCVCED